MPKRWFVSSLRMALCWGGCSDLRSSLKPTCCHKFPACLQADGPNLGWLCWSPPAPVTDLRDPLSTRRSCAEPPQHLFHGWHQPPRCCWPSSCPAHLSPLVFLRLVALILVYLPLSLSDEIPFFFRLFALFIKIVFNFNPDFQVCL